MSQIIAKRDWNWGSKTSRRKLLRTVGIVGKAADEALRKSWFRAELAATGSGKLHDTARLAEAVKWSLCRKYRVVSLIKTTSDQDRAAFRRVRGKATGINNFTFSSSFRSSHTTADRNGDYAGYGFTKWQPGEHTFAVQSYFAANLTRAIYVVDGVATRLSLPSAYRWANDENGIKIVRRADSADFHPRADDLAAGVDRCISALVANVERRAAEAQAAKDEARVAELLSRADESGVTVCLADALRAGNCRAGCEAFAARHNLDPSRHYPPRDILADPNGDRPRAQLAVIAAVRRHLREERQGYASLAEHYAGWPS